MKELIRVIGGSKVCMSNWWTSAIMAFTSSMCAIVGKHLFDEISIGMVMKGLNWSMTGDVMHYFGDDMIMAIAMTLCSCACYIMSVHAFIRMINQAIDEVKINVILDLDIDK